MDTWLISIPGFVVGLVYCGCAACIIHHDRTHSSGGWINLSGLVSALATAPVWFPLEYFGMKPNFRKNSQMVALVLACAVMVYFATAFLVWAARSALSATQT